MIRMLGPAVGAALMVGVMTGCRDEAAAPRSQASPPPQRLSEREVSNLTRLQNAPAAVQISFERDFPGATVEQMQTLSPPNGPLRYQITFVQDGQPMSAAYTREGTRFRMGNGPAAPAPSDMPPPTTQPAR